MRKFSINAAKLTLVSVLLISLFSAASIAETLTLEQSLGEAAANSPMLKSAAARAGGAEAGINEAKSAKKPQFILSETVTGTNNPVYSFMSSLNQREFTPAMMAEINKPGAASNFNTRLGFQQALYTGGMAEHGITASSLARDASLMELERTRQQIRFDVKAAYFQIIIAEQKTAVADKALQTAREHSRITKDKLDAGMIVESDNLSAKVREAELEEMRLSAENDLKMSKSALLMRMGAPQDRDFSVDPSAISLAELNISLDDCVRKALANRADLKALDFAAAAKGRMAQMSISSEKPQLYLMGNIDADSSGLFNAGGESWFVGLAVNKSLSDGGRAKSKATQASASADELSWQREQLRQGVELETRQAFLTVQTAKNQMAVMKQAVEQSQASFEIVNNRYANGLALNVEVLSAEASRTQAQLMLLMAQYQYALGVERLKFAMGEN